jgi:hypothetical protein
VNFFVMSIESLCGERWYPFVTRDPLSLGRIECLRGAAVVAKSKGRPYIMEAKTSNHQASSGHE